MTSQTYSATPELIADFERLQQRALMVGALGLAICAIGWMINPDQFYRSYLVGFLFWNGVALGCLAIAFLHQLSGGAWGIVIRRILEAASRTFPVTLILFAGFRDTKSIRVVPSGSRRGGPSVAAQSGLLERAVFPGSGGFVLRDLADGVIHLQ